MILEWSAGWWVSAVIAGAIAAPAAMLLNTATVHAMHAATAHTGIPASFADVFPIARLALLSLAALAIPAVIRRCSLLARLWAAPRPLPATALRAEVKARSKR